MLSVLDKMCIDIGASPGGWTQCLLENGASEIVAVDPGELRIENHEGKIIHKQCLYQDVDFVTFFFGVTYTVLLLL